MLCGVDVAIEVLETQETFATALCSLCLGGKECMRWLLSLVQSGRFDPMPLLTHTFVLDDIARGRGLSSETLDKVMKVAIRS
jgi:threonine dehydrogenase-like Zn-dependent dehydrogenase